MKKIIALHYASLLLNVNASLIFNMFLNYDNLLFTNKW